MSTDYVSISFPFFGTIVAGWPSPAEEELLDTLSFDEWLRSPDSFMITAATDAMQDAGIHKGDIVVVQRGRAATNGDTVIANVDNEWLLRYYRQEQGQIILYPANGLYEPIKPRESLALIGVVTAVIRKYY